MVKKRDELVKKAKAGKLVEKKADTPAKTAQVRTFNVFVDNEYFSVDVDPIGGSGGQRAAGSGCRCRLAGCRRAPSPAAAAQTLLRPPLRPRSPRDAAGTLLLAPMPGMIVKYRKNVGDAVSKGETIVILEAMKMENALTAPCDGSCQGRSSSRAVIPWPKARRSV